MAESNLVWTLVVLADFAIKVIALFVVPHGRKPTAAMAWLLLILLIPFVGLFLFLVLGSTKLGKARMQRQAETTEVIRAAASAADLPAASGDAPAWFTGLVQQNTLLGAIPMVGGNAVTLLDDYPASIAAIADEIGRARHFVHVEFFIVAFDATTKVVFDAMADAVSRGVRVRLLMDYLSSRRVSVHAETVAELDRIGVEWEYLLPVRPFKGQYQRPDLRNHRKIVVVDGRIGFTGSQNLIDRSYDSPKNIRRGLMWQELMARVSGPTVAGINAVFLSDWLAERGEDLTATEHVRASELRAPAGGELVACQIVPSGPGFPDENNLRMFLGLIYGATERLIITSPYFVPDEAIVYAITSACQRGVDVQLFVSEIGDQGPVYHAQRSYYSVLLAAGVRIFLYPAPYILHAKHLSVDDEFAYIGSSNMDIRSFALNFEISMLVRGASFVRDMRVVEEKYRTAGRELTPAEWAAEPRKAVFFDGIARLTSALE